LSLILFLKRFANKSQIIKLSILALIMPVVLYTNYFVLKRPFALSYNRALYAASARTVEIRALMASLPDDQVIMAPNHLAAHLTHKQVVMVRDNYQPFDPEYIIFDTNAEQSPNNWYEVKNPASFMHNVQNDESYHLLSELSTYQIWKKN
jgi:hypothetical protein